MINFKKQLKPRIDLNPSSADRWTTCTASPRFIMENWDKLPPEDKTFADPGTTAHEVAAATLESRPINLAECPVPVTAEMRQHAFDYWDYIQGIRKQGCIMTVEKKFPLWYMPGRNAKIDVAIWSYGHLHIIDLKYGEGIMVSPMQNPQCAIYARCVIEDIAKTLEIRKDCKITIHIFQPRAREGDTVKVWETTWAEIQDLTFHIHNTAQAILVDSLFPKGGDNLVFAPSDKTCQWCPLKNPVNGIFCEARQKWLSSQALTVTQPTDQLPATNTLSGEQRALLIKHGNAMKQWIDAANLDTLRVMCAGGKIPGYRLGTSRGGNRYWTEPAKAAKLLLETTILREDDIYSEPKLIGPAAVEKLLGKGQFPGKVFSLISKLPGQPVIVPEDDPRENYLIDATKEFVNQDQF